MKNRSPQSLALTASAIVSAGLLLIMAVLAWQFDIDGALPLVSVGIPAAFILSYAIFYYVMERFIYDRIKLIYKLIYNIKSPKGRKSGKPRLQEIMAIE